MYRRGDVSLKKRFSKISIHSLGFRIFVLLAVMIVLFCALVVYNNTAAFGLMLDRIHENSENTLVLYQKSLDENLSRTETYLYVFALNDADLLSLRAAEPQTTGWYVTLNRIKKSFESATPNYTVDGFFCYQEATDALVLYDQTSNPTPLLWNYIRKIANTEDPFSVWNLNEINGKYYLVRILNQSAKECIRTFLRIHSLALWSIPKRRTAFCIFPMAPFFCAPRQAMSAWRLPA